MPGVKAEVAAVTERAMRGEIDFEAALAERVALLAGLDEAAIDRCRAERVRLTPGARALVRTMKREGAFTSSSRAASPASPIRSAPRSASTGWSPTGWVSTAGRLDGTVAPPIVGAEGKRQALLDAAAERGLAPRRDARGRRRRQRHSDAEGGRPRRRLSRQARRRRRRRRRHRPQRPHRPALRPGLGAQRMGGMTRTWNRCLAPIPEHRKSVSGTTSGAAHVGGDGGEGEGDRAPRRSGKPSSIPSRRERSAPSRRSLRLRDGEARPRRRARAGRWSRGRRRWPRSSRSAAGAGALGDQDAHPPPPPARRHPASASDPADRRHARPPDQRSES